MDKLRQSAEVVYGSFDITADRWCRSARGAFYPTLLLYAITRSSGRRATRYRGLRPGEYGDAVSIDR